MDDDKKIGGLGPVFQPTGEIDADMAAITSFYAPSRAKTRISFKQSDENVAV
ncbi:MAG: hypothetical protein KA173_14875 [Rhodoferax sp.]|nr:hypothetical protein [Rhodoferax sp.]